MRRDFREALRRLVPPSEYIAVLSQHTKFTNKEGIFGDADIMTLTQPGSEHMIPTYQFWHEHGKLLPVLHCKRTSNVHINLRVTGSLLLSTHI